MSRTEPTFYKVMIFSIYHLLREGLGVASIDAILYGKTGRLRAGTFPLPFNLWASLVQPYTFNGM